MTVMTPVGEVMEELGWLDIAPGEPLITLHLHGSAMHLILYLVKKPVVDMPSEPEAAHCKMHRWKLEYFNQ